MAAKLRFLLPDLPPELRYQVYKYLSIRDNTSRAITFGLPLQNKKYECKHTKTQIWPVHYGSGGLLALRKYKYQEAREYHAWLLHNAVELRIVVQFTGRVNTFVQADWDKKMTIHLRKLARQHPWLTKTSKYDVQIIWAPTDCVLQSRKKKRLAGHIPRDILKTFTLLMDEHVKMQRGNLNVGFCLDHSVALHNTFSTVKFGLAAFLCPVDRVNGFQTLAISVSILPGRKARPTRPNPEPIDVMLVLRKANLHTQHITWEPTRAAHSVISKTYVSDHVKFVIVKEGLLGDQCPEHEFLFRELVIECLGQR